MYDPADLTIPARATDHDQHATVAFDPAMAQVAVILDADAAEDLARILAQVGTDEHVPTRRAPDEQDDLDPDRWLPVLVDLVIAAQHARDAVERPVQLLPTTPPIVDAASGQPYRLPEPTPRLRRSWLERTAR